MPSQMNHDENRSATCETTSRRPDLHTNSASVARAHMAASRYRNSAVSAATTSSSAETTNGTVAPPFATANEQCAHAARAHRMTGRAEHLRSVELPLSAAAISRASAAPHAHAHAHVAMSHNIEPFELARRGAWPRARRRRETRPRRPHAGGDIEGRDAAPR